MESPGLGESQESEFLDFHRVLFRSELMKMLGLLLFLLFMPVVAPHPK